MKSYDGVREAIMSGGGSPIVVPVQYQPTSVNLMETLEQELTNLRVAIGVKTTQKVVTESALRKLRVGTDPEEVELVWRREMRRAEP